MMIEVAQLYKYRSYIIEVHFTEGSILGKMDDPSKFKGVPKKVESLKI